MTKTLTDGEILSRLNTDIKAGVRYAFTKLSQERRKVQDYYLGKLPAPQHAGNSRYVSTDVYDTVESAKAVLLETFSAHGDIVQFSPRGEDDVPLAKIATAYTKHVIFEQNGGTEIFASVIHDGLMNRNSVVKVYWDKCDEEIEETFEDLTEDLVDELLSDDMVTLASIEVDETGTLFSGTLTRREDRSQVRIVPLPLEEFILPPQARSLASASSLTHRTEKTKAELKREGFDPKLVDKISEDYDDELAKDPERLERNAPVGGDIIFDDEEHTGNRKIVVHETYIRMDIDGSGVKLWKIVHAHGVIIDKEQVLRHPFIAFAPLPTPHRFWGENFAARVIPTQNAKTVLIRSILDHTVLTNNPRYGVVKGALTNPRELLDNRIGGLVNVTRQDGIFPLPQAPMNPFVFQTIGMLDDDKEDVTGVSRLSQGLNKDAISNQNSQGMVEQLISASMQRQKTMARAFAAQFLGPLYLEVYRLAVENESRERIIEIGGSYVPVTPSSWVRQRDVTIDFRLGYGERDQRAQEYLMMGQMLASDPTIAHLYTPQERYNVYRAFAETKGHKDISMFLKDPAKTQPPGPDPMVQLELQLRQQELELNKRKQDLAEKKQADHQSLETFRADMERRFEMLTFALKSHEQERKAAETENRIEVAQAEVEMAQEAMHRAPPENEKATAIVSPNG